MNKNVLILSDVLKILDDKKLIVEANVKEEDLGTIVRYVSFNSRDIEYNSLFICKGTHFDKKYLEDAIKEGAFVYLSESKYEDLSNEISYIIVSDIRKAMAYIADVYTNHAWKDLTLIGITGTKGKSTTAYFVKYILDDYLKLEKKKPCGIISGIDNYDGVIKEESHLTTPESLELHKHFANAVSSGLEYLTMEVSSQALKYDRVLGIQYEIGCFLNVGEDHISDIEHSSFEDYFKSKLSIFNQCNVACVNLDIDYPERVLKEARKCSRVITFGLSKGADIYAYDITTNGKETSFTVQCDSFTKRFKLSMQGFFNVYNALAAISIGYALNIPLDNIYHGLKKAKVSGRMEIFNEPNKKLHIVVDYAHNKMSFEALFESTKKDYPDREISIVFGCPGKKAQARRKELGEIAGKYANKAYITEEDAGEEPVLKICEEIVKHMEGNTCECSIIEDREEAIREAIKEAAVGGVVLITGKGRETRQKRGLLYVKTRSDVKIVKNILEGK